MSSIRNCRKVPITDVLSFIVDNRGKTVPTAEKGIPLIATNCVLNEHLYPTFDKIRFVSKEVHDSWFRAYLKPNDILFVNKGTPGRCCLVPDPVNFCAAQDMIGLRCDPSKIYYRYLLMVLRAPSTQKFINNYHVGIAIPHFKKDDLPKLEIPLPEMDEQIKLGDLYFDLCNLIESNNKISAELEELAKTIYDYWFLQFEFPNGEGKPYKSSGGKMVYNEELKREIPEGWEVKKFDDIADDPPKLKAIKAPDYKEKGKYPIVDQADTLITGYTDDDSYLYDNDECVVFGDVTTYFKYINFPFAKGTDGTKIIKSKNNRIPALLLYYLIKDSKLPNVGFARHYMFLREIKVVIPDLETCKKYVSLTKSMMLKRKECIKENQQLASLRDWLLPMLMNGQVAFKESL